MTNHRRLVLAASACLLGIVFVVLRLTASPSSARAERKNYTKATVARVPFALWPDASAPPNDSLEILLEGLDAEVAEEYEANRIVDISEADAGTLKERGDANSVLVAIRDEFNRIFLNGKVVDTRDAAIPPVGEQFDSPYVGDEQGSWLIQFVGPIKVEWLETMKSTGIVPVQYVPMNGYIVGGRESALNAVSALPFVQWTSQMHRYFKPTVAPESDALELWIELAATDETDEAIELLAKLAEGEILSAPVSDSEVRVQGVFRAEDISLILSQPLVFWHRGEADDRPFRRTIGFRGHQYHPVRGLARSAGREV